MRQGLGRIVAVLITLILLAPTFLSPLTVVMAVTGTNTTSQQMRFIAVKLWNITDKEFAWFIDEKHVLLGDVHAERARADVTLNKRYMNYVAYTGHVEIRDVETGEILWSDTPPSDTIRIAIPSPDGTKLIKVVDITGFVFPKNITGYEKASVWVVPYGIVTGNDANPVMIYDFQGNLVKKFHYSQFTNYGYTLSSTAMLDSVFVSPDGKIIVVHGGWIGAEGDNDLVVFDSNLNPLIILEDIAGQFEATVINEYYIATVSNTKNELMIIDLSTLDYKVYNGTPVSETNEPVYMALLSTVDGKYLFAIKEVDDATDKGVLEVWEWNGGTELQLIETYDIVITGSADVVPPSDNLQPMSFAESSFAETFPIGVMPGIIIYYNMTTKQYSITIVDNEIRGRLAAISPQANYAVLGDSVYLIVKQDVQLRQPRVRFWGTMIFERGYQDLGTPLILSAPSRDWHLYFYSGRLTIKRVYVEPVPVDLVEDTDIINGRLSRMLAEGLVSAETLYTDNAEVSELEVIPGSDVADMLSEYGIGNPDNYVAVLSLTHFTPPPYFWEGHAWTGTVIHIPLDKPINVYDDIVMQLSTSIHTTSLLYDKNKRALAILGVPVEIGGGAGVGAAAYSRIANRILVWYASKHAVDVGKAAAVATSQTVAKVAGVVGIAVAVWGGVDAVLVEWGGLGDVNVQSWIVIAPVVEDRLGNRYTAVELMLPLEESSNVQKYYDILSKYFIDLGYVDVGFRVTYPCRTWDEYRTLLAAGYSPQVRLDNLIEETVAAKYGLDVDELRIVGVDVIVVTAVRAKETFWEWLFGLGGVDLDTVTLVGAAAVTVKGRLKAGTITDPEQIVALLGKVTVNGVEYPLVSGVNGAYTDFSFTLGAEKLVIDFGRRTGYFADLTIDVKVLVKKEFQPLGDFGYTAVLHYDWEGTLIRIERIEFTDMPYPMYRAERIFVYRYGNFTNDITGAFELSQVIDDPESPSGRFYYYITRENTKFIDPANGGIMQPCKTYVFNYYYREPPDAGITVYLNGTRVTSTLAHHATVAINSTVEQDVEYALEISVKYFEGMEEKILMSETITDKVHVPANGTTYKIYDITSFVDAAIEFMRTQNRTAYLELIARITRATYNYCKDNDKFRVVYYPPPLLPPPVPSGTFNVTVKVYEYVLSNSSWIPSAGAVVEAYYGADIESSKLFYTATTSESGVAVFTLEGGTWTFRAVKEGFTEAVVTAPIFSDTVIQLYLSPVPQPPPENRTYVKENVTVVFNVYDATSGSAVPNATITLVFAEPANSSYYGMTFEALTDASGKATLELPIGFYNITVNATSYRLFQAQHLFDKDIVVNIALVPEAINAADYAKLEVRVYYADGKPYTGAHVEIRNATDGTLIIALATDGYGNATALLPKGYDYKVTVSVSEQLYSRSFTDSAAITLAQDTTVTFTVPWNSTQPPITINATPYYWLTVQVVWANGLPFHGAVVEIFNCTSGELIDRLATNGTGTVHFLLPAFQKYIVWVNATNPYNVTQNYQAIFILNLTDHRWITVELPWLPEQPELAGRHRVLVYAYDIVSGKGVEGATVVVRKGDTAWIAETNSTGYAELWVPFLGLYNVTGIHPDYQAVWRTVQVYENNTLINLPMSPVLLDYTEIPPPPLNSSAYPPIYINGTPYYWLSVQVLYRDGYPFHGANVTVIDLETNLTMAAGATDVTGFVYFLVPADKTIKYTVDAFNPELNETCHDERVLDMTQHYYFVHQVPWTSKFFAPEVWLKEVRFVIHRGQGYFFGNVSHLVLLTVWTNKPQTVTVLIGLYNVAEGIWVANKTVTLTLAEGLNTIFEWVDVNASAGGRFRVFANITGWEYDTDPTNNWAWSNTVFLKPMVDIQVFVLWRPVEQKQPWTLLPEDVIEIDIGIRLPINTTTIPAKLVWRIEKYDLGSLAYEIERGSEEEVRVVEPGMVWRNITVRIPWTSRITVFVNVTHPWEDFAYNNYINVTIPIDPDVKIEVVEKPTVVMEGSTFKVVVNVTSNVEPGKGIGWVSVVDNTTATLLKRVEIELAPRKTLELEVRAPENPVAFWIIRAPTTTHCITAQFAGYDLYTGNNAEEFTVAVVSYQWLTAIAVIAVVAAVLAALRALAHTIHEVRLESRRFVRRRSFLAESIWDLREEEERRFVKKKED